MNNEASTSKNKQGRNIYFCSKISVAPEHTTKTNNIQSTQPPPQEDTNDPLYPKFKLLSANGNSSCSGNFLGSIPSMSDTERLQGSCCSPMAFGKYKDQVAGLKKYSDVAEIPSDPYDIPASLAKQLLEYDKTITPTADSNDENIVYAASPQGLFISKNQGASWDRMFDGFVSAIAVHPQDSQMLLSFSEKQRLAKSSDGGKTWEKMSEGFNGETPLFIVLIDRNLNGLCAD